MDEKKYKSIIEQIKTESKKVEKKELKTLFLPLSILTTAIFGGVGLHEGLQNGHVLLNIVLGTGSGCLLSGLATYVTTIDSYHKRMTEKKLDRIENEISYLEEIEKNMKKILDDEDIQLFGREEKGNEIIYHFYTEREEKEVKIKYNPKENKFFWKENLIVSEELMEIKEKIVNKLIEFILDHEQKIKESKN